MIKGTFKKMSQIRACGRWNACKEKKKEVGEEEKKRRCTSNSGSSSKMSWVADASSLCLDCKGEKKTKDEVKKKTQHMCSGRKVKSI